MKTEIIIPNKGTPSLFNAPNHSFEYASERFATQKRATPAWVDYAEIRKIYNKVKKLNAKRKRGYCPLVVDHIIPLKHPDVCGLHVHWNLRIVSATENARKFNFLLEDIIYETVASL